jgi:hypothetical protein
MIGNLRIFYKGFFLCDLLAPVVLLYSGKWFIIYNYFALNFHFLSGFTDFILRHELKTTQDETVTLSVKYPVTVELKGQLTRGMMVVV